ncbi:MAG: shikimate dehydrogenase, partial [Oscillospiraceae bacterium]|nr:shikimate dehydrogenase [Oscillospiraceae bacterium]
SYDLCPLQPEELSGFFSKREFRGINVTIPYKKEALRFCDHLTETAREIGSVNTVIKQRDGTLLGDNTDLAGFRFMLAEAGISLAGKHVLILGSGGASLTVQLAAKREKAASVTIVSRQGAVNYGNVAARCQNAQVLINTTPLGMFPHTQDCPLALSPFPALEAVADLIYNPLRTRLLQQAQVRGLVIADGLSMLAAQAKASSDAFTGDSSDSCVVRRVLRQLRQSLTNWVLIGMPGSGKSSIGRFLAENSGRQFIDLDDLAQERAGIPLPDYFAQHGEAAFRTLESECVADCGKQTGLVIATGGGVVLREENVRALRQNGKLLWIQRRLEQLARSGRPLSVNDAALQEMQTQRLPLYAAAADAVLTNHTNRETAQREALDYFNEGGLA